MIRRLSTLVSAVSLVLCVATCALWVRSYWVRDHYGFVWRDADAAALRSADLSSANGVIDATLCRVTYLGPDAAVTADSTAQLRPGWGSLPMKGAQAFLLTARKHLNWRQSRVDCTRMSGRGSPAQPRSRPRTR